MGVFSLLFGVESVRKIEVIDKQKDAKWLIFSP